MTMTAAFPAPSHEHDMAGERYAHEADRSGSVRLPDEDATAPTVKCGNKQAHGAEPGYHFTAGGVRECYASTGRFSGTTYATASQVVHVPAPAPEPVASALPMSSQWHSTGPAVEQGHWLSKCPGATCPVMGLPEVTVDDAVAKMRANLDAMEAHKAADARARYAAWRSIPVFVGNRAYYALEMNGTVHFFKVNRPAEGPHKGKTFVEEQASDNFFKMGWVRTGEVLDAIAADPESAGRLYGQHITRCYKCHRTLTTEESRVRGLGPECAKRS